MLSWFRRYFSSNKKQKSQSEWFVVSDNVKLALLHNPVPEDMFWLSLEIAPLTTPADPRLSDDGFWLHGVWEIIDVQTNKPVPNVIVSSAGLNHHSGRILLRGIYYCL